LPLEVPSARHRLGDDALDAQLPQRRADAGRVPGNRQVADDWIMHHEHVILGLGQPHAALELADGGSPDPQRLPIELDFARPGQLRPQFLDLRLRAVELGNVDVHAPPRLPVQVR